MRLTLAKNLAKAVQVFRGLINLSFLVYQNIQKKIKFQNSKPFRDGSIECDKFLEWCDGYQVQIIVLSAQISWSEDVEMALSSSKISDNLKSVLNRTEDMLKLLADLVLQDQPALRRKKLEHLIYEYVHRRSVTR